MRNKAARLPEILCLCLLALGSVRLPAADAEIEKEIAALDPAAQKQLARDMAAKLETHPAARPQTDMKKEIASLDQTDQKQLARDMAAKLETHPAAQPRQEGEISPAFNASAPKPTALEATDAPPGGEEAAAVTAPIIQEAGGHCLITTGDRVCFPIPAGRVPQPEERFFIYKRAPQQPCGVRPAPAGETEQVGKLKIIELRDKLAWGCVILANDVILAGDVILLTGNQFAGAWK